MGVIVTMEREGRGGRGGRRSGRKNSSSHRSSQSPNPKHSSDTHPSTKFNGGLLRRDEAPASRQIISSKVIQIMSKSFSHLSGELADRALSDNTEFLVVGVLGTQGSGKSSLLSSLFSHERTKEDIFPPQSLEQILASSHATEGIHFGVSPDRVIFLDTQPILSSSVLAQRVDRGDTLPPEAATHDQVQFREDLELALFLFSVCHVVLVVQTDPASAELWQFLRTVELLKWNIPDVSTPNINPVLSVTAENDYHLQSTEHIADLGMCMERESFSTSHTPSLFPLCSVSVQPTGGNRF